MRLARKAIGLLQQRFGFADVAFPRGAQRLKAQAARLTGIDDNLHDRVFQFNHHLSPVR
ncbi:hypothetical protein D3C75_1149830 [compost metagenome]